MNMEKSKATDEAQIHELIEERMRAVHAKDINRLMSNHAPDVLSFDVLNPLQNRGADPPVAIWPG
jgi:ketosteroid isomerase-like protein